MFLSSEELLPCDQLISSLPNGIVEQLAVEGIILSEFTELCNSLFHFFKKAASHGLSLTAFVECCRSQALDDSFKNELLLKWFGPMNVISLADVMGEELQLDQSDAKVASDHHLLAHASLIIQFFMESNLVVKVDGFYNPVFVETGSSHWWTFVSSMRCQKQKPDDEGTASLAVAVWRDPFGEINSHLLQNLNCSLLSYIARLPGIDHECLLTAFPVFTSAELVKLTDSLKLSDLLRIRMFPRRNESGEVSFIRIYFPTASTL